MDAQNNPLAYTDGDVDTNNTNNPHLFELIGPELNRRQTMRGIAAATAAFMGSSLLAACDDDDDATLPDGQVSAGADITTSAGRVVTLTGSGQNDGVAGIVGWEQVSGPAVTLTNAGTPTATFIAPGVNAATPLVFRFRGTGQAGQAITDEVTVTVAPIALGFTSVAKNSLDVVTVPAGYTVSILYPGGDPINSTTAAFRNDGTDTSWGSRAGDHHDGIYYFGLAATGNLPAPANSDRGLLVMNHENINQQYLHVNGATSPGGIRPASEAIKEIECHGVSVLEVTRSAANVTSIVRTSTFNRRITPNTVTDFRGPVAGNAALRTAFSTNGTRGRGTINNCAMGFTIWNTYLTCEENWAGYFRRITATDNANRSQRELTSLNRYGVGGNGSYGWATVAAADATANNLDPTLFRRWDINVDPAAAADGTGDYRNEANQYGWVVEIDPFDATKAPRKRTAMGRFGHEGAWHGVWAAGRKPTFYLGDDSRGEYLYKFVSNTPWDPADAANTDRLAIGDKYLDAGILYVAKFDAAGTGTWLPLVFGQVPNRPAIGADPVYVFADQADILLNARLAADALGATKMDRPEWTATNNVTGEVYLTLTNNNSANRTPANTDAANPRAYNDPRGAANTAQTGNPNGHILRLREAGDNSEALTFTFDIYLFGADSVDADPNNVNLSGLTADNDFSSPDGLWFGRPQNASGSGNRQLLWIQTDDGAFTDRTNNQMLLGIPGNRGDGAAKTITNTVGAATGTQATFVGAPATAANLRRFLVGPKECELTGVDSTPDGRTLFVNIQHPGENGTAAAPSSNWPQSQATGTGTGRPRSATIVITKNDGGIVGL